MDISWTVVYEWSEDGWWVAEVAEVPGAVSQGKTKEEARSNVLDALAELLAHRRERAQERDFEIVKVAS